MRLLSLATAVPPRSYTAADCWQIAETTGLERRLTPTSYRIIRRLLAGETGVDKRHFAAPAVERIFDRTADELHELFRGEAPRLAGRALAAALARASLRAAELDALLICTCTGYLCPGVTSYVAEQLGLRADAFLQDLVGLGCGAAIPTWRAAEALLARQPAARVACVAVEICSAAFFLDDDPGVIISALIFGDGAAATIWTGGGGEGWRAGEFLTLHQPEYRDRIRFETRDGKLRNLLHRSVPELAAAAVKQLHREAVRTGEPEVILTHTGGKDVLDALEAALSGRSLDESRAVFRDYGNMSSPSVLFALERHFETEDETRDLWLTAFGAGFAAHACRLRR